MHCNASTKLSFISVLQFINGEQHLNATFVAASPSVTVTYPVTRINASE